MKYMLLCYDDEQSLGAGGPSRAAGGDAGGGRSSATSCTPKDSI